MIPQEPPHDKGRLRHRRLFSLRERYPTRITLNLCRAGTVVSRCRSYQPHPRDCHVAALLAMTSKSRLPCHCEASAHTGCGNLMQELPLRTNLSLCRLRGRRGHVPALQGVTGKLPYLSLRGACAMAIYALSLYVLGSSYTRLMTVPSLQSDHPEACCLRVVDLFLCFIR